MALLALLENQPSHGFALKRRYDQLLGQSGELRFGQVYSTLSRLERDGRIDGIGLEPGEGADRRVYAITPNGIHDLDQWLNEPHQPARRASELFAKVVLSLVSGRDANQILAVQRTVYLARMRELTAKRNVVDAIERLAGDLEIAHLEADLRWIELAGTRLAGVLQAASEAQP